MNLYKDNEDNYFLGDCEISSSFLISNVNLSNVYNPLLNLIIKSGLCLDYIPFEVDFKSVFTGNFFTRLFLLVSSSKTDQRRIIGMNLNGGIHTYSSIGFPIVNNAQDVFTSSNRLSQLGNLSSSSGITGSLSGVTPSSDENSSNFVAVANNDSLGLLISQPDTTGNRDRLSQNRFAFYYFAYTNHTNSTTNDSFNYTRLSCYFNGGNPTSFGIYRHPNELGNISHIVCGKKETDVEISTDTAFYPEEPSVELQYATNLYQLVGANNELKALPNLKLVRGILEPLKPTKLSNYTEVGNNSWIPVGTLAGRTLVLRCHSSVLGNSGITTVPLLSNKQITYPHYRPSNPPL